VIKAEVFVAIFDGTDPVVKVTFEVTGGFVTFVMFAIKVDAGLVQEPISARTLMTPPEVPIVASMVFVVEEPVQVAGKVQT